MARRHRQGSAGASRPIGRHGRRVPASRRSRARARHQPDAWKCRHDSDLRCVNRAAADRLSTLRSPSSRRRWMPDRCSCSFILGNNPVFTAPADVKFRDRLAKVAVVVYHSLYQDETSEFAHWNIPDTHPLETWGDPRAYDGTVTLMQPLIAPLYDAPLGARGARARSQVSRDAKRSTSSRTTGRARSAEQPDGPSATPTARRSATPTHSGKQAVHDGFIRGTATATGGQATPFKPAPAPPAPPAAAATAAPAAGATGAAAAAPAPAPVVAPAAHATPTPAPTPAPAPAPAAARPRARVPSRSDVWDGRFANNGWLQEAPKPLTKLTWDTAAWISPKLAEEKQLDRGDIIELTYRGVTARMPVFIVPGQPDQSVTVFLGYGRRMAGRVGTASDRGAGLQRLPVANLGCAMVRHRPRHRQDRRPVPPGDDAGSPRDGGPQSRPRRHARGVHGQPGSRPSHGPRVSQDAHALPGPRVQGQQVGHGDRPDVVHRLRRLRRRVRGREQHPGRRQGTGQRQSRDALDPRRPLLHRRHRHAGVGAGGASTRALPAVRERAVRGRLPGRGDDPQLGRPERHGLQPLRGHALLLEQLPLQGAPLQLPALLGLEHGELLPAPQP